MFFKKKNKSRIPYFDFEKRWAIISEFGSILEKRKYNFERMEKLPFQSCLIEAALTEELLFPFKPELADSIEVALIKLNSSFVTDKMYDDLLQFHTLVDAGSAAMLSLSEEKMNNIRATQLVMSKLAENNRLFIEQIKKASIEEKEECIKQLIENK